MEPNYPNYTDNELLKALCSINRDKFPQRVVLLQQELAKRGITYEEQQLPSGERQMVNVSYRHVGANKAVNDEPREKSQVSVVSGLMAFVVAGCLIAPDRESFSMSLEMFQLSFPIILLLAMPLGYLCWRHWKNAQLNQDSWFWGDIKTSDKFMVNAILLSLAGGFMLFHLVVLAFHHKTSQPAMQMAEVVSVYNERRVGKGGPCSYSIQVELAGYSTFEWCNQPQSLLNQIAVGDPIELQGKVSAAGFYVDKFQLRPFQPEN